MLLYFHCLPPEYGLSIETKSQTFLGISFFYFLFKCHVSLVLHHVNIYLQHLFTTLNPLNNPVKMHPNESFSLRRLYISTPLQLFSQFTYPLLLPEHLQPVSSCVKYAIIEQFIEIEVVFCQEIHCARMEIETQSLTTQRKRKSMKIKRIGQYSSYTMQYLPALGSTVKAVTPNCKGINFPQDLPIF